MSNEITRTARTRLRRAHQRGAHDRETINAIVDAGVLCHVGYCVDGEPHVTPTFHWREGDRLYWHGSSASRMMREAAGATPVCVTVTHLDGLVMARSGFHHSVNYRSVMMFGRAREVTGDDAKVAALKAFMDRLWPGRWDEVRPPDARELKATAVVSMPIDEASAKIRTGPPNDDAEDYALTCWAGVVPVRTVAGEPEADPELAPGTPVPAYLGSLRFG